LKQNNATLQEWLSIAEQAARQAGKLVQQKLQQPLQLKSKGFRDLVTDSDLAAQELIVEMVREHFPNHGFLAEEEDSSLQPGADGINWIIDPIDGTTNYSRHIPNYSVSIGISVDDSQGNREMAVGVIYDPSCNELFSTIRGQGATVNGRAMTITSTDILSEAALSFDWSRKEAERALDVQMLVQMANQVRTVRSYGSAALGLAWLAAGRLDIYANYTLNAWDLAAGSLLITEAGGIIGDMKGGPISLTGQGNVLAANPHLYASILDTFQELHKSPKK